MSARGEDGGRDTGWRKAQQELRGVGCRQGAQAAKPRLRPDFGAGHQYRWEGREGSRTLVERMEEEEEGEHCE